MNRGRRRFHVQGKCFFKGQQRALFSRDEFEDDLVAASRRYATSIPPCASALSPFSTFALAVVTGSLVNSARSRTSAYMSWFPSKTRTIFRLSGSENTTGLCNWSAVASPRWSWYRAKLLLVGRSVTTLTTLAGRTCNPTNPARNAANNASASERLAPSGRAPPGEAAECSSNTSNGTRCGHRTQRYFIAFVMSGLPVPSSDPSCLRKTTEPVFSGDSANSASQER